MAADVEDWVKFAHGLPSFQRRLEIARHVRPRLKRFLYKYRTLDPSDETSVDRLRDLLLRSSLWLSSPVDFNDPFDMATVIVADGNKKQRRRRFLKLMKEHGLGRKQRKVKAEELSSKDIRELERDLTNVFKENQKEVGVYSFAGDPRNILMWSHYAGNHTGICLQIDRDEDLPTFSYALPVKYSTEFPETNWFRGFAKSLGTVMLRKHIGWKYEKEHRMVFPENARKYLAFEPRALKGVIFGCKASPDTIAKVGELLAERTRKGLPSVNVYTAKMHERRYQLNIWKHNTR